MVPRDPDDRDSDDRDPGGSDPLDAAERARLKSRLEDLRARVDDAQDRSRAPQPSDPQRGSKLGQAFRMATEMVTAILVGGFIGYHLDQWLGTTPIMMIVFFLLGTVAGFLNVIRVARRRQRAAAQSRQP